MPATHHTTARLTTLVGAAFWLSVASPGFVGTASALQQTLVPTSATWRYRDDGVALGTGWRDPVYNDTIWSTGTARLGYGDPNVVTTVDYGPNPSAKYPTTYFRIAFEVADASVFTTLHLRLARDDGAVVWLNGSELTRSNLPAGPVTYVTLASTSVSGKDEVRLERSSAPASLLVDGTNVLAVEVHQASGSSSDLGFDLELVATDGSTEVTRGPYLQSVGHDSAVLRWRTAAPTDSRVRYGASPGALTNFADGAAATTEHEVFLTGLAADSTVFYAVGSPSEDLAGGDDDHFFRTNPAPDAPVDTRLWVLGDSGTADSDAEAVRNAYRAFTASRPADLLFMLGDNAYSTGTDDEYQNAVFDVYARELRSTPIWPTYGNHDGMSADSATESGVYYDAFTLPRMGEIGGFSSGTEAYYSFDYGDVHFVCLDSHESDRDPTGAMLEWLEQDLAASDARWLVAYWHHPPYSEGSHLSDNELQLIEMRENVLPLLESHGVDLVLSGHSHSYERSFLLDGHYGHSSTLQPWMILDGGDGDPAGNGAYRKSTLRLANEGTVYTVAGSSGQVDAAPLAHPAMLVSMASLGSLVIDIAGDTMDVRFIDTSGIAADAFRIEKTEVSACGNGVLDAAEDCDDGNVADGDCCPADCTFTDGCALPGKASVRVLHDAGDPARDSISWKWGRGGAFDSADLGDPTSTTSYSLCLYDHEGGVVRTVARLEASVGAAWKPAGAGVAYKDPAGAGSGLRKIKLKPGAAGRAKVLVSATGAAMGLAAPYSVDALFAQDPDVVVQLVNNEGHCWSSTFASANGAHLDPGLFQDSEP